jgi:hypothetical protein
VGIDIRKPIGLMFSLLGLILAIYGWVGDRAIYERSLGININLSWGLVLIGFGLIMLLLASRGGRNSLSNKNQRASGKTGETVSPTT